MKKNNRIKTRELTDGLKRLQSSGRFCLYRNRNRVRRSGRAAGNAFPTMTFVLLPPDPTGGFYCPLVYTVTNHHCTPLTSTVHARAETAWPRPQAVVVAVEVYYKPHRFVSKMFIRLFFYFNYNYNSVCNNINADEKRQSFALWFLKCRTLFHRTGVCTLSYWFPR